MNRKVFLWDAFCFATVFGIWPRFIEPRLLKTTQVKCSFSLPSNRSSFKIVQISDLHFHQNVDQNFLQKLKIGVLKQAPDLIVITGDFLCYGQLDDPLILKNYLKDLKAPFGTYAVLGNHDYSGAIGINANGDYDVIESHPAPFKAGFSRLFKPVTLTGKVTDTAKALKPHPELLQILHDTSIQLLNNRTVQVEDLFNISGVGEHMAGQVDVIATFENYSKALPGILLAHNPDAIPLLKEKPGQMILCGHTHGGQINLPWIRRRFAALEHPQYYKGLFHENQKMIYVSRGIGGTLPFRFNAVPEIVSITLTKS